MNKFALRFDINPTDPEYTLLFQVLRKRGSFFVVCREMANTRDEHIHAMIICKVAESTLRKDIQKIIIAKGNKSYSLKQVKKKEKWEGGLRYTCKGTARNVYDCLGRLACTPIETIKYNNLYWDQNEISTKKVSLSRLPLFLQIFDKIRDDIDEFYTSLPSDLIDEGIADKLEQFIRVKVIHFYMVKVKCFPNPYYIKNLSFTITAHAMHVIGHCPKIGIAEKIYGLLFPNDMPVHLSIDTGNNKYIPSPYEKNI